jgi:ureidoacrylate peracid hydrolase
MALDIFSAKKLMEESVVLDAERTAVLVVDMLNDFCKPGGAMVLPGYKTLLVPQLKVLEAARSAEVPIVFVVDSHRPKMRREREFRKRTPHCIEGEWGAQVIDELKAQLHDIFVTKRRYSGFYNTDLHLTLWDLQVDTLVIMGVVTNICVRSTVHDAFFLGYEVIVPEDCVAATGPREQVSSLYDIATHFGLVSNADEVVASILQRTPIWNREIPA